MTVFRAICISGRHIEFTESAVRLKHIRIGIAADKQAKIFNINLLSRKCMDASLSINMTTPYSAAVINPLIQFEDALTENVLRKGRLNENPKFRDFIYGGKSYRILENYLNQNGPIQTLKFILEVRSESNRNYALMMYMHFISCTLGIPCAPSLQENYELNNLESFVESHTGIFDTLPVEKFPLEAWYHFFQNTLFCICSIRHYDFETASPESSFSGESSDGDEVARVREEYNWVFQPKALGILFSLFPPFTNFVPLLEILDEFIDYLKKLLNEHPNVFNELKEKNVVPLFFFNLIEQTRG